MALAAAFALAAPSALASPPLSWTSPIAISPSGSPYTDATTCSGSTTGTLFTGTEVEPWIATNPANTGNSIAVWQQDRYSNGGANGLRAAYSAGGTWADPANQPAFSKCAGGNVPGVNAFERVSDPWVAIASDGHVAYFMALGVNQSTTLDSAMTVSRSFAQDGVVGNSWESTPTVLKYDANNHILNDKNSLTTDRFDPNTAYAIWDRLVFPNERSKGKSYENAAAYYGPTWFTRTTDSGTTWDTARKIWDPGQEHHNSGRNDQSIGNQIVQTGQGTLVDIFDWINNDNGGGGKGYKIAAIASHDNGQTWSDHAVVVSRFIPGVVVDPTTGAPVRTGDIIPEIAYDPTPGSNTVYAIWQGASASSRSSIYFSKSTDGGDNWSDPVIINKVTTTEAFTPAIRVQRTGETTTRIAVNYYDFRNDTSSAPLSTDYWSTESTDGGDTWVEDENSISGTFDQRTAAIARGYFLGDYSGLSAADSTDVFHAVFGQSKGTDPNHHASDIEESDGD